MKFISDYIVPIGPEGLHIIQTGKWRTRKPVMDTDKCVKCGLCARLCPMGSIDPNDVSNVAGKCIKCCACVKGCPAEAKYFDDAGYLYHKSELEEVYARPAANEVFL